MYLGSRILHVYISERTALNEYENVRFGWSDRL